MLNQLKIGKKNVSALTNDTNIVKQSFSMSLKKKQKLFHIFCFSIPNAMLNIHVFIIFVCCYYIAYTNLIAIKFVSLLLSSVSYGFL